MRRLFTGLALPDDVAQALSLMQGGVEGAKWTHHDDFHLTLTFLGEVEEASLEDLDAALARVRTESFDFALSGTGSFAQGKWPNVLWMGVDAGPLLPALKTAVDGELRRADIDFERRNYSPHVTMARLRHASEGDVAGFMQRHNLYRSRTMRADRFVLYESLVGRAAGEARYVPLEEYYLG